MTGASGERFSFLLVGAWGLTRLMLLLFVFRVWIFPGPDVTSDVAVIYRSWYEVLSTGTFPLGDVTWQYPPAAALAILSPALLPFLAYTSAFFVLAFLADLVAFGLLLYAGRRPGKSLAGVWVWVVGVPLLGPTVYSRYDVMVTAVVVAAILAGARHPRAMGALAAFAALLKVWPALLLVGTAKRKAWGAAATTAGGLALLFAVSMPGAFAFLTYQRDRGTEVESLGSLVFHIARHHGWEGQVLLNYGSVEFLGPYVDLVSTVALLLTSLAFGWLLMWRLLATRFLAHTLADASFVAVLLFTTTSRVISPQYMVWLVGTAAVCLVFRGSRMGLPAGMVLTACFFTVLEFPIYFANVVGSDGLGITLLVIRNGLLVAASVTAGTLLWRDTVSYPPLPGVPAQTARTQETLTS
ncbi:glycosyltransferase 87 family protein [Streptomyces sp. NBC_00878]|uniref:glycosyltransferase 87 family protein n=1 Tax=Streptomyces sp. NBC_00878 TaxID=2975854 RepID=UPI002251A94C|nr:glycosyltransferase 87 family protein [Streptomyces sp. NBC_00878]MCX4909370.1 glycosyltransferase 87 family protein [Streptomyces sp. NBC_00878]